MKFSGYGEGKRAGWRRRRYDSKGNVVEEDGVRLDGAGERRRGPGIHTRFQPFLSQQIDRKTAKALGLKRAEKGPGTWFRSERELNAYLAHEKRSGRDIHWKQHEAHE